MLEKHPKFMYPAVHHNEAREEYFVKILILFYWQLIILDYICLLFCICQSLISVLNPIRRRGYVTFPEYNPLIGFHLWTQCCRNPHPKLKIAMSRSKTEWHLLGGREVQGWNKTLFKRSCNHMEHQFVKLQKHVAYESPRHFSSDHYTPLIWADCNTNFVGAHLAAYLGDCNIHWFLFYFKELSIIIRMLKHQHTEFTSTQNSL